MGSNAEQMAILQELNARRHSLGPDQIAILDEINHRMGVGPSSHPQEQQGTQQVDVQSPQGFWSNLGQTLANTPGQLYHALSTPSETGMENMFPGVPPMIGRFAGHAADAQIDTLKKGKNALSKPGMGNKIQGAGYLAAGAIPGGAVAAQIGEKAGGLDPTTGDIPKTISDYNRVGPPDPKGATGMAAANALPEAVSTAAGMAARTPLGRGIGKYAADLQGKIVGETGNDIRQALKSDVRGDPFDLAKHGDISETDTVHHLQQSLQDLKEARRKEYMEQFNQLPQQPLDPSPVKMDLLKRLHDDYNVTVKRDELPPSSGPVAKNIQAYLLQKNSKQMVDPEHPSGKLDFRSTKITDEQGKTIQKMYNDVMEWERYSEGNNTPVGLDTLKQKLDGYAKEAMSNGEHTAASALVLQTKDDIKKFLGERVPGYRDMTSKYDTASDLIDQAGMEFSLKNTKNPNIGTVIRKLSTAFNQRNEYRQTLLDAISNETGKNIQAELAGHNLSSAIPHGLAGRGLGLGAASLGAAAPFLHHPHLIPIAAAGLSFTSPRLVAEAAQTIARLRAARAQTMPGLGGTAAIVGSQLQPPQQQGPALAPPSSLPNQGSIQQ